MNNARLAVAAGNSLGVAAATDIARMGGNAVDACLAAAIMAWVAEPCMASLGGAGFVAVRNPGGVVEVFDGNSAMPHTPPETPGQAIQRVFAPNYSDGLHTGVGAGSIAVPGVLAAVRAAWERHGRIEWAALFAPAITAARGGIRFPRTSAYYVSATWAEIWSLFPSSRALFAPHGEPLAEGDAIIQGDLGDTLEAIATKGPDVFYSGGIASSVIAAIRREGGFMAIEDLERYSAQLRRPVTADVFGWRVESNPPPASGGALLTRMLTALESVDLSDPVTRLSALVEAQRGAMAFGREQDADPSEVSATVEPKRGTRSSETTHTSAADTDGFVCALTESAGYGAGLIVEGIFLNNTLGEEELNPLGVHRLPPGSRCHSNMAPTIASGPDRYAAIGSPGASRIVGAIAQTLVRLAVDGDTLADAVAAPRAHLDKRSGGETLCFEPGLPGDQLAYEQRPYDSLHMYFGGVQVASVDSHGVVDAAHDPRRSGASALV